MAIPRYLTAQEVAELLGCSRALAYREMRASMRCTVIGAKGLRVSETAFADYLRRRTGAAVRSDAPRLPPEPRASESRRDWIEVRPVYPRTRQK